MTSSSDPAAAGYSGTPLPKKLGIKEGHRVGVVDAPPNLERLLSGLPEGVRVSEIDRVSGHGPDTEEFDVLLLFAQTLEGLDSSLPILERRLQVDGGLWVCWPKQSSSLAGELRDGNVRHAGLALGLVDNKVCAVDPDWSGLRFVFRKEDRPRIREQRSGL